MLHTVCGTLFCRFPARSRPVPALGRAEVAAPPGGSAERRPQVGAGAGRPLGASPRGRLPPCGSGEEQEPAGSAGGSGGARPGAAGTRAGGAGSRGALCAQDAAVPARPSAGDSALQHFYYYYYTSAAFGT